MVLTSVKKKFEGLLEFFFVCKRFCTVQKIRIHLLKILIFFFHMLFLGYAKPSFGWYKVTKNHYEPTATKIRLPGAPKQGTSLIIMSSLGCQNMLT